MFVLRVKPETDTSLWRRTLINVGKMLDVNDAPVIRVTFLKVKIEERDSAWMMPVGNPLIVHWENEPETPCATSCRRY